MEQYEIEEVGLEALSPSYKTKMGVGICYYDPVEEALIEFDSSTTIPIYPLEKGYRRFYIVKDGASSTYNTVSIKAYTSSSEYSIKTTSTDKEDIESIENNNTLIDFFSNHSSGIIPFYFYIESKTTSYLDIDVNIELEVL